ncbi:hypothetical protein HPB47_017549 [Ixodes persulcatus]|uniref:Uncharacterized protein n=1 Tax=Ixodes persulcatus TaxID=34615 RepID=A0AC60QN45_IXOPE|nr:hypothetical protein HPB47_017549 [Ixodes persulcatus]
MKSWRRVETRKKVAEGSILNSPSGARETSNGRWYNRWPEETTLKTLDRHLVEIGRGALSGNWATANLPVTGEMAWSTFKQRDARAKLGYLGRLIHMPDEAYAKRTFQYVRYRSSRTNWSNTNARLDSVYSKGTRRHEATSEKG